MIYKLVSEEPTHTALFDVCIGNAGKITYSIFTFALGQKLPMHKHRDESTNHISICARGTIQVTGGNFEPFIMEEGDVVDWLALNEPHEFAGITEGARLINIVKG